MAEKAKAKKAKALSKKTAVKSKKREDVEQPEELELLVEEMPKRAVKGKPSLPFEKAVMLPADVSASEGQEMEVKPQTSREIIPPIQPRVVLNKPETPRPEANRSDLFRHDAKKPDTDGEGLRLRLSQSLTKKLKEQAADEGISLEEFVSELLAESVVLRAWEIVERKNAMKGHSQQSPNTSQRPGNNNSNQGGSNRGGQRGNNQGNKGHRGMSHVRYQTIMDDKATFLEYVRSQEKTRR